MKSSEMIQLEKWVTKFLNKGEVNFVVQPYDYKEFSPKWELFINGVSTNTFYPLEDFLQNKYLHTEETISSLLVPNIIEKLNEFKV